MQVSPTVVRAILAAAFAVAAALGVLHANRSWLLPGASSDSVQYLEAAESFERDGTLSVPIAPWAATDSVVPLRHYPPGVPLILAAGLRLGLRSDISALWVLALGAAASLGLAVWMIDAVAGPFGATLVGALLMLNPVAIQLHLALWSEPVFVSLILMLTWTMARQPRASWAHGILAALALFTRYVGVAATGAVVLWALIQRGPVVRRLSAAAWAALPSVAATVYWLWEPGGTRQVRALGYYPGILNDLAVLPSVLLRWFGGGLPRMGALLALAASLALLSRGWRRAVMTGGVLGRLTVAAAVYSALHIGVVIVARVTADPAISLDGRILYPVLVLVTLGVVLGVSDALQRARPITIIPLVVGLAAWPFAAATEARGGLAIAQVQGRFYSDAGWVSDPVIWWLDNRSSPWPAVYSNEPALVRFHTGRAARTLPRVGESLSAFADVLRQRPGPIVVALPLHPGDLSGVTWQQCLDLEVAASSPRAIALVPRPHAGSGGPWHPLLPTCSVQHGGVDR